MSRNTVITVLLVIAAAVLSIGLFIAGAIWRGRFSPKPSTSMRLPLLRIGMCTDYCGYRSNSMPSAAARTLG